MAKRVLNRRVLRKQAEQADASVAQAVDIAPAKAPLAKKTRKAPARPKKPRAKKVPPRMRARWGVFNNSMKQVASFDYNQRAAADAKLAELLVQKKGAHFLQIVKEPMPEPELAAALPLA